MKNKIAIASAFLAAASFSTAEIVINEFLSVEGFVDMSYSNYDGEFDLNGTDIDESGNDFGIDQVEISWLFNFDPVTAQIDLQYEENSADDVEVEQAFVNYRLSETSVITAGRFASMLGFEAFEPTGLYQYSTAYGLPAATGDFTDGILAGAPAGFSDDIDDLLGRLSSALFPVGPRYNQGVKYTYETDSSFYGLSILDGVSGYSNGLGGDSETDGTAPDGGGYGAELAAAFNFDNGISYFAGLAYENGDGFTLFENIIPIEISDTEQWIFNTYVTYETGAWLFAAEFNYGNTAWNDLGGTTIDFAIDSTTALIMANYAYSDQASVTGRISYLSADGEINGGNGDLDSEAFKYTLAHNYAFTDNLLLVTELSYTDSEADADNDAPLLGGLDADYEEVLLAVELLFTF